MFERKVIAAANRYGDLIVVGVRHFCPIMRSQIKAIPNFNELRNKHGEEQGFIDNKYNFLNREEALELVKSNGQPFDENLNGCPKTILFSEGVW